MLSMRAGTSLTKSRTDRPQNRVPQSHCQNLPIPQLLVKNQPFNWHMLAWTERHNRLKRHKVQSLHNFTKKFRTRLFNTNFHDIYHQYSSEIKPPTFDRSDAILALRYIKSFGPNKFHYIYQTQYIDIPSVVMQQRGRSSCKTIR